MKTWEFFGIVEDNLVLLISISLLVFIIQNLFKRKFNIIYLDPLGYQYIMSLFALIVLSFLSYLNHISIDNFLSILLVGFAFYLGLGKIPFKKNNFFMGDIKLNFYPILIPYLLLFFISIYFFGLPIFLDSRVQLTSIDSGSLRFISKFLNYYRPILLFISFILINHPSIKFRKQAWFAIMVMSIEALTSGSKSGLLLFILYPTFIIRIFNSSSISNLKRNYRRMVTIGFITIPMITIILYGNPFVLLYRAVMSGDIYYHVLPNYLLWKENYSIGLSAVFPSLAKLLGLVDLSSPGFNLGNDIYEFYYNIKNMGPTRRLPLFLFLNLGLIMSAIISFSVGKILKLIINKLLSTKVNTFYLLIWIPLFFAIFDIQSDYGFALSKALEVLLIGIPYLTILKILRWHK